MPNEYNSSYTGVQIDTAIGKVGTTTLTTTASNLSDAVNELNSNKQASIHVGSITLEYNGWSGAGPWTQTATIKDANDQTVTTTSNTKVDVQPDATALGQLIAAGVQALYISNSSGTLTAYAVGAQPAHSSASDNLVLQVTYYETTT